MKIKQDNENKEHKCNECDIKFDYKKFLTVHLRDKHGVNEYANCEMCFKEVKKSHLNRHIKNQHFGVASSCDECGKTYSSRKNLINHQSASHKKEEVLCESCFKMFSNRKKLGDHLRKMHNTEPKSVPCESCNKIFKTDNDLYLHNLSVHDEVKAPCELCGKVMKNKYALKRHIKHGHSVKQDSILCA